MGNCWQSQHSTTTPGAFGIGSTDGVSVELVDRSRESHFSPHFGATLRAARLSRNVSLDDIAAHTKINRLYFQDLERNDLSRWPASQFYCESYLRAYALAVGIDPHEVIDAYRRQVAVDAEEDEAPPVQTRKLPAAEQKRWLTPITIPIIVAVTFVIAFAATRWAMSPRAAVAVVAATPSTAATQPAIVPVADRTPGDIPLAADPTAPIEEPEVAGEIEGELFITSTPPGAHVTVNGIGRGPTPIRVRYLPAGNYTVRVITPGHAPVTRYATISAERRRARISVAVKSTADTN